MSTGKTLVYLTIAMMVVMVAEGGFYDGNSNIVQLTKENFAETVFGDRAVWVVECYANWCGHCKNLAPQYITAAEKLQGLGAIDCDAQRDLCGSLKVEGFPTLFLFESELKEVDGKKGGYAKPSKPYNGPRTSGGIVGAALAEVPNIVSRVDAAGLMQILSDTTTREMHKVIVFTDKSKTSELTKGLALEFFNKMVVVETTDKSLATEYKVNDYPAVVVVPPGDAAPVSFDGVIKRESVFKWLKGYAKSAPSSSSSNGDKPKPKPKTDEPSDPLLGTLVEVKTQTDYESVCTKSKSMCVLAFLDTMSDEYAENVKILTEMAQQYKNNKIFFGFTDGPNHVDILETYFRDVNINFPSIVTIVPGKNVYFGMQTSLTTKHFTAWMDGILRGSRNVKYNDLKNSVEFPEVARPPLPIQVQESGGDGEFTHQDL